MGSNSKYVKVICEFCKASVEKPVRFLGYNHTFCNRTCHGKFKLANPRVCSVGGCEKKRVGKGLCQTHYDLERRNNPKRKERVKVNAEKNRELIKQKRKQDPLFDAKYRQKSREYNRKYRHENLEERREADKLYWKRPVRRFNKAKKAAEKRGIEFALTLDEYAYLTKEGNLCFYNCGGAITYYGIGLDRKNNNEGYTISNAVPCCGFCNNTKNANITSEEMLEIVNLLKRMRNSDNIWVEAKSGVNISNERRK